MLPRWVFLAASGLSMVAVALALALVPSAIASSTVAASITGVASPGYSPHPVNVDEGGTITWTNDDQASTPANQASGHSVTAQDGSFDSGASPLLFKGDTFSHAFTKVGTFAYSCIVHSTTMSSSVIVDNLAPNIHITAPAADGGAYSSLRIAGTADDVGQKVKLVEASIDGGQSWRQATLGDDLTWSVTFDISGKPHGALLDIVARATDDDNAANSQTNAPEHPRIRVDRIPVASFTFRPGSPSSSDTVQFNDTSTDPDLEGNPGHGPAGWSWDLGDGNRSTDRNPQHQFLRKGQVTVTLTVTDDDGGVSLPVNQTLTIRNSAPRAAFTASNDAPGIQEEVAFTDTSADIDGRVVTWAWSFGDGATSTARNASHAYAAVGAYTVTLNVTDDDGVLGTIARVLNVQNVVGKRPFANITADALIGRAPLAVNFTLQGTDPDGSIVNWTLDYGDGTSDTGSGFQIEDPFELFPPHVYGEGGLYEVVLRTTDDDGNIGTGRLAIHVDPPENRAPRVSFDVLPDKSPPKNSVVRFNDTSVDPDADDHLAQWRWDFGDGTLYCCDRPTVDHVYLRAGQFNVTLAVTDGRGATNRSQAVLLQVQGARPAVLLGTQPTSGRAPLVVAFTLAARDSDGRVDRWSLDFGDGSRDNASGPPPNQTIEHTYAVPGVFAAVFVAVDDDGLTGQQVTQVQVQQGLPPALTLPPSALSIGPVADQRLTYLFGAIPDVAHAASYAWSFGDGHTGTGRQVTYAYDAPGHYDIALNITDAAGNLLAASGTTLDVAEERASAGPGVRTDVASGVVRVTWDRDPRAAGYQVWRAPGEAPSPAAFQVVGVVRGQTSYSDENVQDGAVYTYRVTFFSGNGDGRFESLAEVNRLTTFRLLGSTTVTGLVDSDGDGVGDSQDAFPHDPTRTSGKVPGLEVGAQVLALLGLAAWMRRREG